MSSVEQLADRAFRAAEYDFGRLLDTPGALLSRGDRQGVRLLVAPTLALPDAALDAILAWRLGQYLLTGFYDAEVVAGRGMVREDSAGVHPGDVSWRRGLGLALFWTGLGLVRSRSPRLAVAAHVAAKASGVLLGHATGRDQF
jgi:hypothetical protein